MPKRKAFEDRQSDTGWGWAAAHLIPLVALIYAIKRKTVTPILYSMGGTFGAALILGIILGIADVKTTDQQNETAGTFVALVSSPLLAKAGIEKARKFAAQKLEEDA